MFLSYKHSFPLVTEISLTMTHTQKFLRQRLLRRNFSEPRIHRNFWDNEPQKFLQQRSTEISGTTIHRNFWDNVPQKFLGQRSTEISGTTFHRNFLSVAILRLILARQFGHNFPLYVAHSLVKRRRRRFIMSFLSQTRVLHVVDLFSLFCGILTSFLA